LAGQVGVPDGPDHPPRPVHRGSIARSTPTSIESRQLLCETSARQRRYRVLPLLFGQASAQMGPFTDIGASGLWEIAR